MRVRIQQQITCAYESPIQYLTQILRLTPRNHDGQFVRRWLIDVDFDTVLRPREEAFGNISHLLTMTGPLTSVAISVEGEVETQDTNGVVGGAHERFPSRLYLRETALTNPGAGLATFAREAAGEGTQLDRLHALLKAVHDVIEVDPAANQTVSASEAFVMRKGSIEDAAQIFIAGSRSLGIPARYVSGYICQGGGGTAHGWAEAHVDGLGWIGFDPANIVCATDSHVRVSIGLDYLGAAPIRSVHAGTCSEKRTVAVAVKQAQGQRQS